MTSAQPQPIAQPKAAPLTTGAPLLALTPAHRNAPLALIAGAGIAGLAAAWWLHHIGWRVHVVERASHLRDGGHMMGLSGPGLGTARRMGLTLLLVTSSENGLMPAALGGTVAGALLTTQVAGPLIAQEAGKSTSVYEQLDLFGDIGASGRKIGQFGGKRQLGQIVTLGLKPRFAGHSVKQLAFDNRQAGLDLGPVQPD